MNSIIIIKHCSMAIYSILIIGLIIKNYSLPKWAKRKGEVN